MNDYLLAYLCIGLAWATIGTYQAGDALVHPDKIKDPGDRKAAEEVIKSFKDLRGMLIDMLPLAAVAFVMALGTLVAVSYVIVTGTLFWPYRVVKLLRRKLSK